MGCDNTRGWEEVKRAQELFLSFVERLNCEMNLCLVVHWSNVLLVSSLPRPVQELLSEQSCLILLGDTTKQRPAGTPLARPEDTFYFILLSLVLALQRTHFQYGIKNK